MKRINIFFLLIIFITIFSSKTFAESSYVLPYPGSMPGNIFYKVHLILEKLKKYWYFGDFAQFDYNLQEADHYLVESKTLFEYKQYLLAILALKKSNQYYIHVYPQILAAQKNGKSISEKLKILQGASIKHVEVLEKIIKEVPKTFYWNPEKGESEQLNLHSELKHAISLRN